MLVRVFDVTSHRRPSGGWKTVFSRKQGLLAGRGRLSREKTSWIGLPNRTLFSGRKKGPQEKKERRGSLFLEGGEFI